MESPDQNTEIEKLAALISPQTSHFLRSIAAPMLATLGTMGVVGGTSYLMAKRDEDAARKAAENAYTTTFSKAPEFKQHPSTFHQRFGELYTISPTIAKNPQLATKLIKDRLHKGFSVDDLHRLSTIEYHASNTRKDKSSASVARAAALGALEKTLYSIQPYLVSGMQGGGGPQATQQQLNQALEAEKEQKSAVDEMVNRGYPRRAVENFTSALKKGIPEQDAHVQMVRDMFEDVGPQKAIDILKANGVEFSMNKKSSAKVSDECMAVMLADRYVMAKTAGLMDSASRGAQALGGHLAFMAPALALGAGTVLAQMAMTKMKERELAAQADTAFAGMKRNNDIIAANPEVAHEAYEAIKAFAPDLAAKPNVLRTFLEHAISTEGRMPIETIKQMAETQQVISKKPSDGGFIAGLKNPLSLVGLKVPGDISESRAGSSVLSKLKKKVK